MVAILQACPTFGQGSPTARKLIFTQGGRAFLIVKYSLKSEELSHLGKVPFVRKVVGGVLNAWLW